MGSTYKAYKTDEAREKTGITLDLGEVGKFKLARAGGSNVQFQKRLMALSKPYRRAIQTGNIDPKVADALLAEAFADTVLLGWDGVTGEDGAKLDFNKANALKLLTDLPDLFKDIREAAEDATLFNLELTEGDAKNS